MASVLRGAGLTVRESSGWKSAGHGALHGVRGVMGHHTAGKAPGDLTVVRDGTSSTADGPLANLYVAPDGAWTTIAAGLAYHAGEGGPWRDVAQDAGNGYLLGVEVSDMGASGTVIDGAQYAALCTGVAAILTHAGYGPDRYLHHRTWAPDRKVDLRNDLDRMRADIGARQAGDAMQYVSLTAPAAQGFTATGWLKWSDEANDDLKGHDSGSGVVALPSSGVVTAGVVLTLDSPAGVRIVRGPRDNEGPWTELAYLEADAGRHTLSAAPFGSRDHVGVRVTPRTDRLEVTEAAFRLGVAPRG